MLLVNQTTFKERVVKYLGSVEKILSVFREYEKNKK